MELARDRGDVNEQQADVTQLEQRFPQSPWLAEALYSSGNMYLLRKDYPSAAAYYTELVQRFPTICKGATGPCSDYAPSAHWRAAWLDYRLEKYSDAALLFDEQIAHYPGGKEIPSAIYWRARIYQDQERQPAKAAAYYLVVKDTYLHYYYAQQAAQRLTELGSVTPADAPELDSIQPPTIPALTDDVPEDDPHVVRAKLLANAGLNEYIAPEIQAAEGSEEWGAFAEAEIYHSYGEDAKAMRVMKRALPFYTSAPIESIPLAYWHILFPEPYWGTIESESAKNGLDPFMVASLIRQESEFNPTVVSYANAWGLMQLLPSVGSEMARKDGIHHFDHNELLDPVVNIKLGTKYLRQTLDKFDDKPEYAFAAYNAGDDRVTDWRSGAPFHGIDEFVESIPFTETREYVQGIVRNEMIYRDLATHVTSTTTTGSSKSSSAAKGME
jgi:soluble lytic murein transglycosylase